MNVGAFIVLPVGILQQFRDASADSMEAAQSVARSFALSGHDEVVIMQPVAIVTRSTDVSERSLLSDAQDATPLHIERQLELVPRSASDTAPFPPLRPLLIIKDNAVVGDSGAGIVLGAATAQADGAAEPAAHVCGFVADDGRVCVAMPHDTGAHLLEAPVTDASRTVQASGQP